MVTGAGWSPAAAGGVANFDVQVGGDGETTVVQVAGELDLDTKARFSDALTRACSMPGTRLIVDVSQLTFIDAGGASVLVAARGRLLGEGRDLAVQGVSRLVRRAFEVTGLTSLCDDALPVTMGEGRSVRSGAEPGELDLARQRAGLSVRDLFIAYFALGGTADLGHLVAHLAGGRGGMDARQRDVAAHAVNERLADLGRTDRFLAYAGDHAASGDGQP